MKVAIIGGGVSGLSLAYYLKSKEIDFVLFEKEKQLGGNACTRQTVHNGKEKFVDMAVNDFNPQTYHRLTQLMGQTRAQAGRVKADTSFHTSTSFLFRESDLRDPVLAADIERFRHEAMEVIHREKYQRYSVKDYFEEKGYSPGFLRQYLYPRLQGLFFYPEGGVDNLPVLFVMNFYALQGGFKYGAAPASTRHNFKGGAGAWIESLARQIPAGKIIRGESPVISRAEHGFRVNGFLADKVVFACHADDLCNSYGHILAPEQYAILSRIQYAVMRSVAHCDTSYLPVSGNEYSAYNCYVKGPDDPYSEYTITYNCNEHQNLSCGGDNDFFFVTVNPVKPIADEYILRDREGIPLVKEFRRNICDFGLLRSQEELPAQQGKGCVYFTGGYTNGIGLHENCLKQSSEIAEMLHRLRGVAASPSFALAATPA